MLKRRATWVRKELLRLNNLAPEIRIASSLSAVEIFTALYYGRVLRQFPTEPLSAERDRCIISKGHGSICMYPILADLGFFDKAELSRICQSGSFLGGIPDPVIPGYETVNGSLGHGLGVGTGMALGIKSRARDESVFVVCGDGELHEGSIWEAVMFASQHALDNLNLVVDNNSISMLGFTDDIISHGGFKARFEAFGWSVSLVNDGHDIDAVTEALLEMKELRFGRPKVLVVNTVKGKGISNLENHPLSHVLPADTKAVEELLSGDCDD